MFILQYLDCQDRDGAFGRNKFEQVLLFELQSVCMMNVKSDK